MPDDNPFRQELKDDNPFRPEEPLDAGGVTALFTALGLANNALALPGAAVAGAAALPRLIPGGETFTDQFQKELGQFPANLTPTVEGIGASIRAVPALFPGGDTFTERKSMELADIKASFKADRERHPFAAKAGDVLGDVATLLTARIPLSKLIKTTEQKLFGKANISSGTGPKQFFENIIKSDAVKKLGRGAGRTLEAGLEATVLDMLKGDDPFETAGVVMGAQAASSAVLQAGKFAGKHPFFSAALSLAAIIQIARQTIPGGEDSFIDSLEDGFKKVQLGIVLAVIAGSLGGGRLRGTKGNLERTNAVFADSMQSVLRVAVISLAEDFMNADPATQEAFETTLGELIDNPDAVGEQFDLMRQRLIPMAEPSPLMRRGPF